MLLWINGPFGVGKTTAAHLAQGREPRWRIFDPETVGSMLRANLRGVDINDFQDLRAWRALVPAVAHELMQHTGDDLLTVQTVLSESHWQEIRGGLAARRIAVTHVVLDADADTLRTRIAADRNEATAAPWRLEHIPTYLAARSWLLAEADLVIDAANTPPAAIADTIVTFA